MNNEKRQSPRVTYKAEVSYGSEDNFYLGFTGNISEGGLFISTNNPMEVGSKIKVKLTLPGIDQPVELDAEVRWVRDIDVSDEGLPPGMGVRFLNIPEDIKKAIQDFIKEREPEFYPDD